MKNYQKLLFTFGLFFFSTFLVYALSFPISQPLHQSPGGEVKKVFTNISQSCGIGKYIQGITASGNLICQNLSTLSTLSLTPSNSNYTLFGSGKYTNYFYNILNNCGDGRYLRGFNADRKMICSDKNGVDTLIGTTFSDSSVFSLSYPTLSLGIPNYTKYLQNIVANTCGVNESITGFDENGIKLGCQTMIVNGVCGSANATLVTTAPTTGLCSAGSASSIIGTGTWVWKCNGVNGGTNAICAAGEKTYYLNTISAASAFGGIKTTNLGSHKHCVISRVYDDLERSTWSLTQTAGVWSITINDEGNSSVARANVMCTDELPGDSGNFLAGGLCTFSGLTGILDSSGCCVVGNSGRGDKRRVVHGNFAKNCSL